MDLTIPPIYSIIPTNDKLLFLLDKNLGTEINLVGTTLKEIIPKLSFENFENFSDWLLIFYNYGGRDYVSLCVSTASNMDVDLLFSDIQGLLNFTLDTATAPVSPRSALGDITRNLGRRRLSADSIKSPKSGSSSENPYSLGLGSQDNDLFSVDPLPQRRHTADPLLRVSSVQWWRFSTVEIDNNRDKKMREEISRKIANIGHYMTFMTWSFLQQGGQVRTKQQFILNLIDEEDIDEKEEDLFLKKKSKRSLDRTKRSLRRQRSR